METKFNPLLNPAGDKTYLFIVFTLTRYQSFNNTSFFLTAMTTAEPTSQTSAVVGGISLGSLRIFFLPYEVLNNLYPFFFAFLYCSCYICHRADCSCFGLPALSVSLPQQRRLQDNRGAGSRRGPRRGH